MKKMIFGALALAGVLGLGACSGNGNCNGGSCNGGSCKGLEEDQVYTGVLPAADADGIRYTLKLDYDDDHNYTDGDYKMLQTYLKSDSVGTQDVKSIKSKGDFTVEEKDGKKYLKLVEKRSNNAPVYFWQENDSTLTMVNDSLQPAANPAMNYSLKLVK